MDITLPVKALSAFCLVLVLTSLGGCLGRDGRAVDLASSSATAKVPAAGAANPQTSTRPLRLRSEPEDVVAGSASVPRPNQIFDFHPRGSRADSWRQPFVVDPNDGPLASYVRQTAEELKAFKEDQAHPSVALGTPPSKAARRRPGCDAGKAGSERTPCAAGPQGNGSAQLR